MEHCFLGLQAGCADHCDPIGELLTVHCSLCTVHCSLFYNLAMRVTVGVSGGIAAYKAAELVRALQRQALEVHVVMTAAACKFMQPLTFASLTGNKVITSLWDDAAGGAGDTAAEQNGIEHIGEAQWAEALVVAPATANVLAKFAHGIADDFLTTMYLATTAPVLVAPAMNVNMWNHPATQANVEMLRQRGVRVVEPGTGDLACGMVGAGRMAEPDAIADAVLRALGRRHDMAGEVVLVTAGGTREALDPVRFLGNRSSGKMGYALAEAAQSRGAKVILVSGPTALHPPAHCEVMKVITADEMREAVLKRMAEATMVVKAAAVADYRPVTVSAAEAEAHGTDDAGAGADRRHSGRGGAAAKAGAIDCGLCGGDQRQYGQRAREAGGKGRGCDCGERCDRGWRGH